MMNIKKRVIFLSAFTLGCAIPLAFADAPVVDVTQNTPGMEQPAVAAPAADSDSDSDTNSASDSASDNSQAVGQQSKQPSQSSSAAADNQYPQATADDNTADNNNDDEAIPSPSPQQTAESLPNEVKRLQQQMSNLVEMDLPQEITNLQQSIQQLQGALQVQAHEIKMLSAEQRSFYQDLNQRIQQLNEKLGGASVATNSSAATSANANATSNAKSGLVLSPASEKEIQDSMAYNSAFDLLAKKQYVQAKQALTNYIQKFPKGKFLVNAHYWLGELYYLENNFTKSTAEFNVVITKFPKSDKAVDAKLKSALILLKENKIEAAKSQLKKIINQHPGTTAAQLASIHLQQLNAEANGAKQQE